MEHVRTFFSVTLCLLTRIDSHRRDKLFFKTEAIKCWVIVVYESQNRFPEPVARQMATGFIEGAESVGEFGQHCWRFTLTNDWHTGMTVLDKVPSIFYRDGSGDVSDVGSLSLLPFVLDSLSFLAPQTSWSLLRQLPEEDTSQPHCGDIARRRESDLYRSQRVRQLFTYVSSQLMKILFQLRRREGRGSLKL